MKTRKIFLFVSMVLLLFLAAGCFPGGGYSTPDHPAGFFMGIWHGWIAPVSLIWGLFDPSVRIYEANNTGWWYDFGFYISVIAGFGSISLARRKKHESRRKR